jgi:hypothetical protein
MRLILAIFVWSPCAAFRSRSDLVLENLALRRQLATFAQGRKPEPLVGVVTLAQDRIAKEFERDGVFAEYGREFCFNWEQVCRVNPGYPSPSA